jgi:HemY protein
MRRVVLFLAASAAVLALSWWVAHLPGTVALAGFGYSVETSSPIAVVGGVVLLLALLLVLRVVMAVLGVPGALRFWRRAQARRQGDTAVGRALVALAAGEAEAARRAARRARDLLGDTPQTLLLAAESARLGGNRAEAEACYQALVARADGAFLGLRGLFRLAVEREDWTEAGALARRAEALQPGANWLREARLRVADETGQWGRALALAGPDLPEEVLATAAAQAEADPQGAARLARQAWKANPAFAPAVVAHAAALRREGHEARAEEAIIAAWRAEPHPDLAAALLEEAPDARARLRLAVKLSNARAEHVETQYLLGRLSLAAGEAGEARFHAERARGLAVPTKRILLLLADIAAAERRDPARLLREAAEAPADPAWTCGQCGARQAAWRPACPACHTPARIAWVGPRPLGRAVLVAEAVEAEPVAGGALIQQAAGAGVGLAVHRA